MKKVWLDLEETIIDSWSSGLLVNTSKVRKWISDQAVTNVSIWSFAIWDEKDWNEFSSSGIKNTLERALNVEIYEYLCVDDVQKKVFEYENVHYESRSDFMSLNGKHWSFIKYCMHHQQGHECILLDDVVPSWVLLEPKTNTIVRLVNIVDI